MAKINDLISSIEQILNNNDLSSSAHGKQLADEYAAICNELNSALAECRNLFQMGAYSEARRLNVKAKPSLTDRFNILNFSRRAEWVSLCNIYSWQSPPTLDTETVRMLNSKETPHELSIEELQNRWRRIIRDGSLQEKLILARKIYALDRSSVWRANLMNAERPYVNELIRKANEALEDNRSEELTEIFNELISPELLQKVPSDTLDKFRPAVVKHNESLMTKTKNTILDEVANFYMAMDLPQLEQALSKWSALQSNPIFSATPDEMRQIAEAKKFLLDRLAEANAEAQFTALQSQLEMLLNEEGNPKEIDRIYHSLQQLDRPIKKLIEIRMEDFYQRLALDNKRKHIRTCIAWGVSAFVVALLTFITIFYIQGEKELRDSVQGMKKHLADNNFSTAAEYYKKIESVNPQLADRSALKALYAEAVKMQEQAIIAEKEFNKKCAELEKVYFKDDKLNNPAITEIFKELDELAAILPQDKKNIKAQLAIQFEDRKSALIAKNEIKFRNEILAIQREWNKLFNNFNNRRILDAEKRKNELERNSNAILNKYKSLISQALYKQWEKNIADNIKSFNKHEENRDELLTKTKNLYQPVSASDYFNALRRDLIISSEVAEDFNQALNQLSIDEPLHQIISSSPDDAKLRTVADQYLSNPFCREINRFSKLPLNTGAYLQKQKQTLENITKTILPQYNVYEIILMSGTQPYHFYFNTPDKDINIEYNRANDRIKSLQLSFLLSGNNLKYNAIFTIDMAQVKNAVRAKQQELFEKQQKEKKTKKKNRKKLPPYTMPFAEQTKFMALKHVPNQFFDSLPEKFTIKNPEFLLNKGAVTVAAHHDYFKKELENLTPLSSEKIFKAILKIAEDKNISNFYVRINMLKNLMSLLPTEDDPLYKQNLSSFIQLLNKYSEKERGIWQYPMASFKYPGDAKEFDKQLRKIELKKSFSKILFSEKLAEASIKYPPMPIGVFYEENGVWRIHAFGGGAAASFKDVMIMHKNSNGEFDMTAFSPLRFARPIRHQDIDKAISPYLYNGQLIYNAYGMDSWRTEKEKVISELRLNNFEMPTDSKGVIWPAYWPVNMRYIGESAN